MAINFNVELKQLRKDVLGHFDEIAELSGKSVPTVSCVLRGVWVNEDVLIAAKKVRTKIKENEQRLAKLISK